MKRKNMTRSALFTSVVSLLLCVSMLIGTTFAWFTDTAESGLNQIVAGNLDVELLYKDGNTYKNAADVKLFDDIELWEPGMVAYETVKIANVGNLALKYALSINTGNENFLNGHGLSEVLHFAVIDGEIAKTLSRAEVLAMAEGSADKGMLTGYTFNNQFSLEAKTESNPMTLIVYWPENGETDNLYNANNEQTTSDGQALHIDLGLKVFASQETVEKDSFDKYYDDTADYPENKWLGDVAEKLVIDETTKTISIGTGAELAKLAQEVNSGKTFEGYTVKLTDHIDLNNIAWTPVGQPGPKGTTDFTTSFRGNFDGQNHTVYNLKAAGEGWQGLIGLAYKAEIKNLKVVNANVSANRQSAAVVGQLYGSIDNVHVENVVVNATPNAVNGGYDNGDKIGGIVGWLGDNNNNHKLTNSSATNVHLKAYRDVGGIAGYVAWSTTVSGNNVQDVDIVVDQATNHYGDKDFNGGAIVGRYADIDRTTVSGNSESDVTISYVVATEKALRNAMAKGGFVTLGADVAVDADTTINVVGTTVLDLNGYTLSGVSEQTGKNSSIIVAGKNTELTVKNGTVTMEHKGANMGWSNSTNALEAVSGGKLTLDHVYVKNLGGSDMAYAVNIANNGGATLKTIASTLESVNYNALRIFNNADGAIKVDLTEGTVLTGKGSPFFVHFWTETDLGAKMEARQAYLEVNFNDTVVSRYSGSKSLIRFGFDDEIYYSDTAMTEVVAGTEKALNWAIANGKNVLLNNDLKLTATVAIPAGTTTVLDLNGKKLSYDSTTQNESMITNKGTLTINDSVGSGEIYYNYTGAADPSFSKGNNTISNGGTLTVNGGKIHIANLSSHAKYPIDNNSTTNDAVLVINGGHLYNYNMGAIRQFCNSTTYKNSVTVNGGLLEGYNVIWMQNPNNKTVNVQLTITGGELRSTAKAYVNGTSALEDVSSAVYCSTAGGAWSTDSFVNITGGIFNENIDLAEQAPANITCAGATFNGYVELP